MRVARLTPVLRGLALSYLHLPLLVIGAFAGTSWSWLALVGVFPWIGMMSLFWYVMVFAAFAFLPGVREGHLAAWLAPPMPAIIVFGGGLALFLPVYRLALDRVIDHTGRTRWRWSALIAIWTLSGNALALLFEPRGLR